MRRPSPHHALTLTIVALAAALLAIGPEALLVMAPALALAWVVGIGAFTGTEAVRWVRRVAARLRRRRPVAGAPVCRPVGLPPLRGGLLPGAALASRPPPHTA